MRETRLEFLKKCLFKTVFGVNFNTELLLVLKNVLVYLSLTVNHDCEYDIKRRHKCKTCVCQTAS